MIYTYKCKSDDCPVFDLNRPMDLRNDPAACPCCGAPDAERILDLKAMQISIPGNFQRFKDTNRTLLKETMGSGPWEDIAYRKWDQG